MCRPLLSHKNSHIVFREKGGSQSLAHSFSQFCTAPSPHRATCSFSKRESRRPGHDLNRYASIRGAGPGQQPLLVAERAKAPLVTEKKQKLTLKVTLQGLCQQAWAANVRRPITQVTPLIAIGTCLCGLCPFRIMPPSLRIFLVLAFSSPLF